MKKIIVLGAGLIGKAITLDLNKSYDVTAADINPDVLDKLKSSGIKTVKADLSTADATLKLIKNFDLIVGAVPGYMGYNTVKNVIEAGKDMVDISFMPQDPANLDEFARKKKVCIVTDCGIAPGMGNIILGFHNQKMDVKRFECLVGGLPVIREWPYEYKAVFSPIDVIEEYVRPARYIENGALVTREALSDAELVQFEGIGTLEAWNSDGLRSLIRTMKIPNMIEKTLRYPGTIEYLKVLRETGFFSYNELDIYGKKIRPIDLTARLLFPKWELNPGEEDFTVMRITIEGFESGKSTTYNYNLLDRYNKITETISMARTTGYTCTAVVNLILEGKFSEKGINPPEYVGENPDNYNYIINYLHERGVEFQIKMSKFHEGSTETEMISLK